MPQLIEILLALVVCVLFVVIVATSVNVLYIRYSKPPSKLLDLDKYHQQIRVAEEYSEWALQNGFEWIGAYRAIMGTFVAAWVKRGEPTYFCVYILASGIRARDFVTILNGDKYLSTGDSKDACLLPTAPGHYMQTFPGYSIQEQWDMHKRSFEYLVRAHLVSARSNYLSFEEAFYAGVTGQMKHVMSLPLWPLRAPYWFFVRRRKMRGILVEQLIEMGFTTPA